MIETDILEIIKIKNMTAAQKKAVFEKNTPIVISASAGSGKTFCLTSRFLAKILRKNYKTSPEKLLLLTFSKNAADEIYSRIIEKIEDILKIYPNNIEIKKIRDNISKTNITTIDSFCHNILKQNNKLCNISKNFKITYEYEIKHLKEEILTSILKKRYKKNSKKFQNLCNYFSLKSNNKLKEIIIKIYNKAKTEAFPKLYIENITSPYKMPPNLNKSMYLKEIKRAIIYKIQKAKSILTSAKDFSQLRPEINSLKPTIKKIISYIENIEKKIFGLEANELKKLLNNLKFESFPRYNTKTNMFDKHLAEILKTKYINPAKKIINSLKEYIFYEKEYIEHFKAQKPIVDELCSIIFEFIKNLEKEKRKRNILEFSDLITKTLKLMATPSKEGNIVLSDFGKKISKKFDEIMVDEFQDINNSQNMLIKIISDNNKKLFAVGDIKQSIYGFRHAEIKNFFELTKSCSKKNNNGSLIFLNNNFRSREEITNSINFLFGQIMTTKFGGIDYKNKNKLISSCNFNKEKKYVTEIKILKNEDNKITNEETEIYYIVNCIKNMIYNKFEIEENKIKRPCKPKDFAILLRSGKKEISTICEELEKLNIDYNCNETSSFLKSYEITLLISFLKIISNPMQDIPFCAVAISPMFELTNKELLKIKKENDYIPFFLAFKKTKNIKCKMLLYILKKLREKSANSSPKEVIEYIYNNNIFTKIFKYSRFNNIKKRNLELFLNLADNYNNYKQYGLTGFLKYIENIKEDNIDIESQNIKQKADGVSIMTIHKSKGLEFPIVFVALTNKQFNETDFNEPILISSKFGLTLKHSSKETLTRQNTIPFLAATFFEKKKIKEQELRLLYVAMTRAKQKLILTAVDNNDKFEKLKNKNFKYATFPLSYLIDKKSFYEWILSGFLRHKNYYNKNYSYIFREKEFDCDIKIKKEKYINLKENEKKEKIYIDKKIIYKLKNQINFKYIKNFENIPSKITVTDLVKKNKPFNLQPPNFEENKKPTPREIGTALHNFLQFTNFKISEKNIKLEIKRLVEKEFITERQAKILDIEKIKNFFSSKAYKEIKYGDKITREKSFICEINIKKIFKNERNCKILVQGIIDCLIEKNGKLIIIDYKTDAIDEKKLVSIYKNQLKCYKYAMEKILKKPVICCIIYSTHLNKSIKI